MLASSRGPISMANSFPGIDVRQIILKNEPWRAKLCREGNLPGGHGRYNHGMEEREGKRGGLGCALTGIALLLLFLPVLYVLSIGPVALLVNGNRPAWWIEAFYYPLEQLAQYCKPFQDAVNWYVELWTG